MDAVDMTYLLEDRHKLFVLVCKVHNYDHSPTHKSESDRERKLNLREYAVKLRLLIVSASV
jgi:tmRNA-binding protein